MPELLQVFAVNTGSTVNLLLAIASIVKIDVGKVSRFYRCASLEVNYQFVSSVAVDDALVRHGTCMHGTYVYAKIRQACKAPLCLLSCCVYV